MMNAIKISMAQLNATIGDFKGNTAKVINAMRASVGSDLQVFPELTLSGYAPMDMVNEDWFHNAQRASLEAVKVESLNYPGTLFLIGLVMTRKGPGKSLTNSALCIKNGEEIGRFDKQLLPTYDVFDERRYFEPGVDDNPILDVNGVKVGVVICEDAWNDNLVTYPHNPVSKAANGADVLVTMNASPSGMNKVENRISIYTAISKKYNIPVVYVNQVGGNDQVVYDGGSFVASNGKIYMSNFFKESIRSVTINDDVVASTDLIEYDSISKMGFKTENMDYIYQNIQLGLKDYLAKTGFKKVVVGSSGGIDSAVTIALAAAALGPENVIAITMPSSYSSEGSVSDSVKLCENLGVQLYEHAIKDMVNQGFMGFMDAFKMEIEGVALENMQARLRGLILMTYSNQTGAMLLTTGNKSELSVGYATLYGDMAGGLNLIGDLYKTEVYALAKYINASAGCELIPKDIITKPPSAELAPGQRDDDSLPPYDILDAVLQGIIEHDTMSVYEKMKCEYTLSKEAEYINSNNVLERVESLLYKAEFKRRQAPPVIRCRARAFGAGRQMPIACKRSGM